MIGYIANIIGATGLNQEDVEKQAEQLEKLTEPSFWSQIDWSSLLKPLAIGLVGFVVGYYIIRLVTHLLQKILKRQRVNEGLIHFLTVGIKGLLYFFLVTILAGNLGIKTTSLVALIGTLGIAIGLALQGNLADLASGILLVFLQPIRVGDYITMKEVDGLCKVLEIRLFQTVLIDFKGFHHIIPNKTMTSSIVTNLSKEDLVGAQIEVAVDHREDIDRVVAVAREALETVDLLNHQKDYGIFVNELLDYGVTYIIRGYTRGSDYASACTDIAIAVKKAFDRAGIRLAHKTIIIEEKQDK